MTAPDELPRWRRFVAARLDRSQYLGLHLTVGLLVASLGVWLFGALVDSVLENDVVVHLDVAADAAIHARVTPLGLRIFDGITQLGSPTAMAILMVMGAIVLWRQHRRIALIGWIAAFVGGVLFDSAVKYAVHRARPTYGAAYLHGHTYSFPSGHAMGSMIGYGMLVYLLGLYWHPGRATRWVTYAFVALLVLAVGVSRLYLGVHYPSDVVGGYGAGAAWLAICLTGLSIAQGRARAREHPHVAAAIDAVKAGDRPGGAR